MSRGFDRFFGMIGGGGNYWDPKSARLGTEPAPCDPETFYYTDAISDHAVRYIAEHHAKMPGKPFFMYVAFTAAHWPMHASEEDIAKFRRFAPQMWVKWAKKSPLAMKAFKSQLEFMKSVKIGYIKDADMVDINGKKLEF